MGAIGCTQNGEREKEIISEIFNIYSERKREREVQCESNIKQLCISFPIHWKAEPIRENIRVFVVVVS